jgi:hypothetical protein
VLYEKHRRSGHSCRSGHGVDSVHDAVDVEGRFHSRTQSLLDIDDEQGKIVILWVPAKWPFFSVVL